mgnify:CR=1 FL=1
MGTCPVDDLASDTLMDIYPTNGDTSFLLSQAVRTL